MKTLLRQPWLSGTLAYILAKLLRYSLRLTIHTSPNYNHATPYLFAFWHGKQFLPVLQLLAHATPKIALVSPSKDGDILSVWLTKLGYEVIRGSARSDNIAATKVMLRSLKRGYSLGFGVDGPTGPIYRVKPGMTFLAQHSGLAIVPLGSAYSRKWIFQKAWDKYQLPKLFAKAAYYIGDPIVVTKSDNLDIMNEQLNAAINFADQQAQQLL